MTDILTTEQIACIKEQWPELAETCPWNELLASHEALRAEQRSWKATAKEPVEWQTPSWDTFRIEGDWLSHENCGFTWHKQHAALDPMEEWCPVCLRLPEPPEADGGLP